MLVLLLSGVLFAGLSAVFAQVSDGQKEGYYEAVKLFIVDNNYDAALDKVNILIERYPMSSEFYLLRGQINVDRNDKEAALTDFDKAVELDSKNDEILYYRAALKFDMGDMEQAYVDTSKCVHLNANNDMCYVLRSMARRELGDVGGASTDMERARAAKQNMIQPQNSLAK